MFDGLKVLEAKVKAFGSVADVNVHAHSYDNGRLAIMLDEPNGQHYGEITVNMPDAPCPDGEVYVKDWSENADWAYTFAVDNDIIEPAATDMVVSGYVYVKRYKLTESFVQWLAEAAQAELHK